MNIFDFINAKELAAYIERQPSNDIPYFGETIFPAQRQLGTDISWLKGSNGLPIAIQPSNYDAKARLRDHTGFESFNTEMAFFREATRIGEKDRQMLNTLINHPKSDIALPIINNIFADVARLVEGVRVQAEVMRMSLIQGGTIDVVSADGRAKYKYDYHMDEAQLPVLDEGEKWSNADVADPVRDLIKACDDAEERTGLRPSRAVMNRTTFLAMIEAHNLHFMINPNDASLKAFYSEQELLRAVENFTGLSIFVYSKKINTLDHATGVAKVGGAVKLIRDGKVILLPNGVVGKTIYGTTPEESDLLAGGTDAQVALVNNGTAVTTYKEIHPVNVMTIVSSVMIPSFEGIDDVVCMTVL